jgi:hypothetical protein
MTDTNIPGSIEYRNIQTSMLMGEMAKVFKSPIELFKIDTQCDYFKSTTVKRQILLDLVGTFRLFISNSGLGESYHLLREPILLGDSVYIGRRKEIDDFSDEELLSEIKSRMEQRNDNDGW